ncbi:UDP-N-acetylmuramoyl-L-alanine--D-glutamate ligase [Denitratisoma oestradiolicum]|uniref:UDP-N-acetylmuramoylalanine--D-glutamate ligase n=1 Tax=Denitratisoma oestradiolicum TaxID=311182 RepID=A0A6S6Y0G3_9PROT|nr:UDP-N-acetylmuramoyl-L-alanine--D-glutamate ligase [Denitratisoma oestradiolicum]TWO80429.1 UDP-N-acetylmuramoyl-L-alanine--D-glutamate ligase [Denitratisoma oestradiolicum]CAB1370241.1 UDP-N-acetylmuramoylalanine--D-glutamate ligase [Denitratisoma oestradiolicum]
MKLSGKHILVLGLGESGLAMAQWCTRQGARVRVLDSRAEPPFLSELRRSVPEVDFHCSALDERFDKALLAGIDLLALSPGLSGGLMAVIHARAQGIPVVGEIELFAWALQDLGLRGHEGPYSRVIAITGTNGKTTTTALTGHLCREAGKMTGVAGNISPAALHALMAALDRGELPDIWVLELSSFQLETVDSLDADAATVLNISDDHLDRYIDLDEYASAKARIFAGRGVQVLNRDDARVKRMALAGRSLVSFGLDAPGDERDFGLGQRGGEPWIVQGEHFLLPVSALPIAGLHNAANAMAALALVEAVGFPAAGRLQALRSFRGLPHRVEKVAEIGGVGYYDDSKGTNVGATVAALEGLGGQMAAKAMGNSRTPPPILPRQAGEVTSHPLPREGGWGEGKSMPAPRNEDDPRIVLIAGGDGKGQDFVPLSLAIARYCRAVMLIGRDGPKIAEILAGSGVPFHQAADMDEAVRLASRAAQEGDAVLLSPACASFDMFRNYEHRALVFVAAVQALESAP